MSREYPCVYYDNQKCTLHPEPGYTDWCVLGPCSHETPSNADHIRSMTDEELAQFIPNWSYTDACKCGEHYVDCNNECEKCVADWLKQPYKEDT